MILKKVTFRVLNEDIEYLTNKSKARGDLAYHIRQAVSEYVERLRGE